MNILAIDTSADETSVAVTNGQRVLSSVIASQIKSHAAWGGIVPTIAKLAHAEKIDAVCQRAIKLANLPEGIQSIGAVAVTYGPGLSIALEIGMQKAASVAREQGIPLYAVNHMEGHLFSSFVQNKNGNPSRDITYPFLGLLISGGHTQLIDAQKNGSYEILGETVDDAAGEALDKAAKLMGLGYPGGAVIEKLSESVQNVDRYHFPRPMAHDKTLNMSFSGLKTHLYYFLKGKKGISVDLSKEIAAVASSFQEAVFDSLLGKLQRVLATRRHLMLAVGGGVSSNAYLRQKIRSLAREYHATVYFPSQKYLCGDNAAMIGVAAHMMILRGEKPADVDTLERVPRLSLSTRVNDSV